MKLPIILGKEFDFINTISKDLPSQGIGDDCAWIKIAPKKYMIFSVDTFVESVHFDTKYFKLDEIGYRCCEAAISDIAAMAGKAEYVLFSISTQNPKIMKKISDGVKRSLNQHKIKIIGGDTTYSKNIILSFTVIGTCSVLKLRSEAKAGDAVFISGYCGFSGAGLVALQNNISSFSILKKAHKEPKARLDLSSKLSKIANAVIDISDGLISECFHIANSSGVSIVINNVPIHPELTRFCKQNRVQTEEYFVLNGGEDFEILYTVPQKYINKAVGFQIGFCTEQKAELVYLSKDGKHKIAKPNGFKHFKVE